jgi:hypothetical protein
VAIDDEIDAARTHIEFDKTSIAPKVVTAFFEALAAVGVTPAKPVAYFMKKIFEQRENDVLYLLETTILRLRGLEEQFKTISEEHQRFVKEQLPRILVEAVGRAEQTGSKERLDRLSLIVVHTVAEGPKTDLERVSEMMRVTVDLSAADIDVLAKIYSVQAQNLAFKKFMPEMNVVNDAWKQLQDADPLFKSSEIYSICSKLQSFGLVTQVPRIATILDLESMPYAILQKGADYLRRLDDNTLRFEQ